MTESKWCSWCCSCRPKSSFCRRCCQCGDCCSCPPPCLPAMLPMSPMPCFPCMGPCQPMCNVIRQEVFIPVPVPVPVMVCSSMPSCSTPVNPQPSQRARQAWEEDPKRCFPWTNNDSGDGPCPGVNKLPPACCYEPDPRQLLYSPCPPVFPKRSTFTKEVH